MLPWLSGCAAASPRRVVPTLTGSDATGAGPKDPRTGAIPPAATGLAAHGPDVGPAYGEAAQSP
jgi:hypothetical protein